MAMDNVLALMLLPLFGMLSDKLRTPLGRRTPFILVGTVLAVICMILLPVTDNAGSLTGFFIALGAVLLSMGFYRSPAVALMPDLTPKPLRSKANAVINLMGALGGIFTLVMISVLVPKTGRPDYMPLFLSVAAVMVVAVVALLLTIRENRMAREAAEAWPEPEEEPVKTGEKKKLPRPVLRSLLFLLASVFLWFTAYNAVTTAFSRYAEEVWGMQGGGFASCLMVATGVAVVSYLPIGFLSSRFGRKKMILAGILLMCAAYVSGIFFGHFSPLLYVVFGLTGVGWASINVNSYPMVVEMGSGADVGKYTGMYYFFSMGAQVFTPIFSGVLLEHISYRTLFPYAAVFSLLSFITMLFVRHGDVKPQKKASVLENFDVDDG